MKKSLLVSLFATCICFVANAKVLRVGYAGPHVAGTDFTNVSGAVTAATAGDTIQLYQYNSLGTANVDKRLVFLGLGYNLDINNGLQAVSTTLNPVTLYFNAGSENSIAQGVHFGDARIGANNITISRCSGSILLGINSSQAVAIANPTIVSSYVSISNSWGAVSNALISNCIVNNFTLPTTSGLVINNISTATTNSFGNCVVKNNIFTYQHTCPSGNNAVFQNNILRGSCNLLGTNNLPNIDMNNVFVNWNGGSFGAESNLALKAGSPAIGAGTTNAGTQTDAGIYGGEAAYVYKPSGIPAIPAIYQLSAPQLNTSTNPYTISISVRSNN